MALENKLGLTSSADLAREEERISKKKAVELFENGVLDALPAGKFSTLQAIHKYLFEDIYDFAGKLRTVNLAKGNFRFAPLIYLEAALANIDKMPQSTFDEIIEKYAEMNIAHPFREGNGRSTRIWLDHILKTEIGKVMDWSKVDKEDYLLAMERSPIKDVEIKVLLKAPEGAERLLMDAGTIPAGDLQWQYADGGSWQFLPGDMAAAAEKAAQLLAETGSAQRSDCVLDRACFAQLEKQAADSRCDYLQRYVRATIDAANLRSLVRTERLHMDPGFLQEVLFEGGSVPVDTLRAGVGNGVAALFRSTALREAAEEGEAAVKGGSLTAFEKACDNAVLKTAAGARQVPFGVEVALGYLIAKEAEWTAVRIVMAGRLAGLSADAIRERLRDAYV